MAAGLGSRIAVRSRRLGNRLGRHDAVPGPGRQDPVVGQEMKPGRGNQSRQLLQQFHRRQQEMAGPMRPRRFEREGKRVGIDNAQTPSRQGLAGHVAAQAFEPPSVRACDPRWLVSQAGDKVRGEASEFRPHRPRQRLEAIYLGSVPSRNQGSIGLRGPDGRMVPHNEGKPAAASDLAIGRAHSPSSTHSLRQPTVEVNWNATFDGKSIGRTREVRP